ncbi:MAG: 4'-phosphopantetheinyl transferase superfamily protein [Thermodesulfobacteriota bacterium]
MVPSFNSSNLREASGPWSGIGRLQSACLGMILLNIDALSLREEGLFTPRETARLERMVPRRRKSFMAARVALKRLARQLGLVEKTQSDRTIETFGPDDQRPCLAESGLYCSVSHDSRMVVAVAHNHPIGVDLEVISNKALRVLNSFWVGREKDLILASPFGPERAATLAWTAKEAAAKALGLNLVQALREIEVVGVSAEEGLLSYQEKIYPVRHAEGDGQVITLITP